MRINEKQFFPGSRDVFLELGLIWDLLVSLRESFNRSRINQRTQSQYKRSSQTNSLIIFCLCLKTKSFMINISACSDVCLIKARLKWNGASQSEINFRENYVPTVLQTQLILQMKLMNLVKKLFRAQRAFGAAQIIPLNSNGKEMIKKIPENFPCNEFLLQQFFSSGERKTCRR